MGRLREMYQGKQWSSVIYDLLQLSRNEMFYEN